MNSKSVLLIRYGELHLKGKNRPYFERLLIHAIRQALSGLNATLERGQGRYFVKDYDPSVEATAVERLRRVFGIYSISVARECEKDWPTICDVATQLMQTEVAQRGACSFKVVARRSDKHFHLNSMQMAPELGGVLLERIPELRVDVHTPDIPLGLEIRESAYLYAGEVLGQGGMPAGSNGRAALLLSGGIDSPVAGHMMMKRGLAIDCVYFHSPPYTSERAKDKVVDLARTLSHYVGEIRLHVVPFTEMPLAIYDAVPPSQTTVLLRRAMMQIAERIADANACRALITGESLGQVASQTLESLCCTDDAVAMPVFRPLIGFDKSEIIERARIIGTFETSILPYEDCCTIFTPKNPVTRPKIADIRNSQSAVSNWDTLMDQAIQATELLHVTPSIADDQPEPDWLTLGNG